MADKLNGIRLRLCAVVWELAEMGHLTSEGAERITQRIEGMGPAEMAAWARQMLTVGRKAS
mgnify:CR=1 FL=1